MLTLSLWILICSLCVSFFFFFNSLCISVPLYGHKEWALLWEGQREARWGSGTRINLMHSVHGIHVTSPPGLVGGLPPKAEFQGHARVTGKSFVGQHGVQHLRLSFVRYLHCPSQGMFCYLQADFSSSASCLPLWLWRKKKAGAILRKKRQI